MRPRRKAAAKIPARYKDHDSGESDHDFQDSGSEASISLNEDSDDQSSSEEFTQLNKSTKFKVEVPVIEKKYRKTQSKPIIKMNKLKDQLKNAIDVVKEDSNDSNFSVKDLTEQQKLLPDFLNLSESDTDDEDGDSKKHCVTSLEFENFVEKYAEGSQQSTLKSKIMHEDKIERLSGSDNDNDMIDCDESEKPVDDTNFPGKLNFSNLQKHNERLEDAKKTLDLYNKRHSSVAEKPSDVGRLLALGEAKTSFDIKETQNIESSDSEFEEVKETKAVPQKGDIQVVVEMPGKVKGKSKAPDIEMILKRRINRIKKEYQVYMHKVHILAWLAHGNYVNDILNNVNLMGPALSLIPSEHCYPKNRVNIKYIEQITEWYSDWIQVKEDKSKFSLRTKKPHLVAQLLEQIKNKIATSNKNKVLIFVTLLRSLGVKCRLVLSFKTVPLRPPSDELCSISTKREANVKGKSITKKSNKDIRLTDTILQLDGADDDLISKKKGKTISKKLSKLANVKKTNAVEKVSLETSLSHWDKITDGLIPKDDDKRISHRDLRSKSTQNVKPTVKVETKVSEKASTSTNDNKKNNKAVTIKSESVKKIKESNNSDKKNVKTEINKSENIKKTSKESNNLLKKETNLSKLNMKNESVTPKNDSKLNLKKVSDKKISKKKPSTSKYFENSKKSITPKNGSKHNLRKASNEIISKKNPSTSKYFESLEQSPSTSKIQKSTETKPSTSKMKSSDKRSSRRTTVKKNEPKVKIEIEEDDVEEKIVKPRKRKKSDTSDADFKLSKKIRNIKKKNTTDKIDRRVLSTDDEQSDKKKKGVDVWCEIYVEEEEQWISVDAIRGQVHCVNQIYSRASHPLCYVVSWDNAGYLKDVTRRYASNWNTTTRKLRVQSPWYDTALKPWMAPSHLRDKMEDEQLDRMQFDAPLPKTVSEYKNHPLYALPRHLLKFEVIYPPDSVTLGFIRNEPVYARECVLTCRSRETWVKEAKVVRLGEEPYKIVKARPKYDRLSGKMITDIPLEIFGPWQVDDYVPPTAEDGKVPRNPYGNVELFKSCMLPGGTVHLVLPGLNRVAKKLGIDCAPAMVGFDYHSGGSHPVYDGYVICEEFQETIVAAWEQEQIDAEVRAREKIDKRVYGNWRKLIRGLLIRERLQARYDFNLPETSGSTKSNEQNKTLKKKNDSD